MFAAQVIEAPGPTQDSGVIWDWPSPLLLSSPPLLSSLFPASPLHPIFTGYTAYTPSTMILSKVARLLVAALAMAGAKAHPHLSPEEMADYQREITRSTETLGRCLELPGMQRLNARMAAQRSEALQHLRKARGIDTSACMLGFRLTLQALTLA